MTWVRANLPADLHRWLKVRAAEEGVTLAELIERLLTETKRKEPK